MCTPCPIFDFEKRKHKNDRELLNLFAQKGDLGIFNYKDPSKPIKQVYSKIQLIRPVPKKFIRENNGSIEWLMSDPNDYSIKVGQQFRVVRKCRNIFCQAKSFGTKGSTKGFCKLCADGIKKDYIVS